MKCGLKKAYCQPKAMASTLVEPLTIYFLGMGPMGCHGAGMVISQSFFELLAKNIEKY